MSQTAFIHNMGTKMAYDFSESVYKDWYFNGFSHGMYLYILVSLPQEKSELIFTVHAKYIII